VTEETMRPGGGVDTLDTNELLQRLLAITHDILRAHDLAPAVETIARGFADVFGWRYVTIVASDEPGGELRRRVLLGYPPEIVESRLGEIVPKDEISAILLPEYEVFPNCYHIAAESGTETEHSIYTGFLPRNAPREAPDRWHERDALVMVLADEDGVMLGYVSPDHPLDGMVPTRQTLRIMQIFVNLLGLALTNARAHYTEVERRRLLEETSRLQNDFFSMVSHEVRSPLAAIQGATALLAGRLEELGPERRFDLLKVLETSTTRLDSIFEDFLLLSRMEAGQLALRMEPVAPVAVVKESIARAQSEHPSREFLLNAAPALPLINADEGRVVQVLANLLSNAIKYSWRRTPISVLVQLSDDLVTFSVTNEGDGIPPEAREKLFTRFGRISSGDNSTGLGLHICKLLVTLMNGRIGFDSDPGRSTTFWFALPRYEQ
jgi:nitrogen-specific signal transduction histidine kinase